MSEPLKGGFASFSNSSPFKPNTGTSLFGNATPAANVGATGTGSTGSSNAFGGGGGLFGNAGNKPASGGLFGGGNTTATSLAPGGSLFTGFGQASGNTGPSTAQATSSTPAASSATTPALGLFGAKPPEQTSAGTAGGMSTTTATTTPAFSLPGTSSASTTSTSTAQLSSTAPAAPTFFSLTPKAGEGVSAGAVPASGGLFGGLKKPDTPTNTSAPSGTTPAPPSLFSVPFGKKDDDSSKDKDKPAVTTGPSGSLFGQPSATDASTTASSLPSLGVFGQNPVEQKDAAKAGEKKDNQTAPLFGASTNRDATATSVTASSTTMPAVAISVPPPSMLRGKTIEEIVNKWSSDLEAHVKEFSRLATEIAVWDRALIDNGNTIAALFQHVLLAEREQSDIEQSLKHVEDQQKELSATLEVYEKAAGELFDGQGGGLRALDVGPADAERDKHYTLAADLNANLDDLSRSLMQMIQSVNGLSEGSGESVDSGSKKESPLDQIAQILSSHLESLQWIDSTVRDVDSKITDVEKRIREASAGNNAANSVSGTVNGPTQRLRGFGLR